MRLWVENIFRMKDKSRRLHVAESSTLGVMDILGELLGTLDASHHPIAGHILTAIDAPLFPTCRSLQKRIRGSEVNRRESQCLKLTFGACG